MPTTLIQAPSSPRLKLFGTSVPVTLKSGRSKLVQNRCCPTGASVTVICQRREPSVRFCVTTSAQQADGFLVRRGMSHLAGALKRHLRWAWCI